MMNGDKPASRQASLCRMAVLQISRRCGIVTSSPFMLSSRSPMLPRLSWRKTRAFYSSLRSSCIVCVTKWSGSVASRSGISNPYLGVFPRFAERFSHRRTLDVGAHLIDECQKASSPANKRSDASDLARFAKTTESLVRHRHGHR